ncbi:heme ABC transporter ATP-binding protein [Loktanella agnita]|uniref:heme ABC transporter ATP-binding protein n=1 Tax=Loktanella agnita TaxID=287097 RepID=UPI00398701E7
MIKAHDIAVTLNGKDILQGIDFTALAGQVTAIVGPNGSGKSTLIKALTQELSYSGEITINGQRIEDYRPWELAAIRGVLPQVATLAFPFTVNEILRLGLFAGEHGENNDLIAKALSTVGLSGYGNRAFLDLSGGEQQRAHLARVLCQVWDPQSDGQPRWLLLDEPVASLDIGHQLIVMRCLRDYANRGGGVIAVMHDLNLTSMIADQVAMIAKGRIIKAGAPHDILIDNILSQAYGCHLKTNHVPESCRGFLLPQSAMEFGVACE